MTSPLVPLGNLYAVGIAVAHAGRLEQHVKALDDADAQRRVQLMRGPFAKLTDCTLLRAMREGEALTDPVPNVPIETIRVED